MYSANQLRSKCNYEQREIFVSNPNSKDIVGAEYFFDTDPGVGHAHFIQVTGNHDTASFTGNISTVGLSAGYHNLYVRVKNSQGFWSNYETRKIKILAIGNQFTKGEYFFDTDPGVGHGISFNMAGFVLNSSSVSKKSFFNFSKLKFF